MDILQIADELSSLPGSGTRVPGFRSKVMVEIDRLLSLAEELRKSVPANIQEATEVLNQKDSVLNQAYLEAQRIKAEAEQEVAAITSAAREEHQAKVGESEILKVAEARAQEIQDEALGEAQEIVQDAQRRAFRMTNEADVDAGARREGADQYSREVLFSLEEQMSEMLGQVRRGIDALRSEAPSNNHKENGVPA